MAKTREANMRVAIMRRLQEEDNLPTRDLLWKLEPNLRALRVLEEMRDEGRVARRWDGATYRWRKLKAMAKKRSARP